MCFFDEDMYVDNPFGKDFIKLEIDHERFDTNKTSKMIEYNKIKDFFVSYF